ncbi:hypothetical protein [Streptacidiphilus rugosus]|uniref:hypothetical protein n=1 Tax=Streptacidiphilus rugosus TaxID=405783 RepID=UPI0006911589|nr:hypothetical protein [Streptacidiphilus rugosus]
MLTIHTGAGTGTSTAVAVERDRIVAVASGDADVSALRAAYPGARVREWPGELRAGLRWEGALPAAPSPRERVHALLLRGVTALAADALDDDPALGPAAARVGLPFGSPAPLTVGARADFAVFPMSSEDPDAAVGADGVCLATVLGGRLVHRRA